MRAQVLQIRAQLCGWVWWRLYISIYPTNPSIHSDVYRCEACLCFLPGGLVFGYTMCAFIAERNLDLIDYGPLILGASLALVSALSFLLIKYLKKCIIYWQPLLLLVAGAFNLLASCFYFADGFGEWERRNNFARLARFQFAFLSDNSWNISSLSSAKSVLDLPQFWYQLSVFQGHRIP